MPGLCADNDAMAPRRPLYLLVGLAAYRVLEGWEAIDTLYFLVSVLSFSGSASELAPSGAVSQLFTCGYGPLGAALFLSALLDPVRWMLDRFAASAIRVALALRHAALAFCACLPFCKPAIWLHGCVPRRYRRLRNAPTAADGLSDAWTKRPLTRAGPLPGVKNLDELTVAVLGPLVLALLGAAIMYALQFAEWSVADAGSGDRGSATVSGAGAALYWAFATMMTGGPHALRQSTWVRQPHAVDLSKPATTNVMR
jgi:hypothetical protein